MCKHTQRQTRTSTEDGFTLLEVLLVVSIVGILSAIAVPGLTSARIAANEASAIGASRSLIESQSVYAATCGRGYYADSVETLVAGGFSGVDIAGGVKSGFEFTMSVGLDGRSGAPDCDGEPTVSTYYWSASPASPVTGRRAFATTQDGTIWEDLTGVVPVEPLGSGAETPLETVEVTP